MKASWLVFGEAQPQASRADMAAPWSSPAQPLDGTELAARELNDVAELAQACGHALAMIALDLDRAILHPTASAAQALELRGARLQRAAALGQAADHRHRLAVAPAAVAEQAHEAIVRDARGRGTGTAR